MDRDAYAANLERLAKNNPKLTPERQRELVEQRFGPGGAGEAPGSPGEPGKAGRSPGRGRVKQGSYRGGAGESPAADDDPGHEPGDPGLDDDRPGDDDPPQLGRLERVYARVLGHDV